MTDRVPEFTVRGDQLAFMQHAHVARRVLEIGKWLALGNQPPVPVSLASARRTAGRRRRDRRLRAGDGRAARHIRSITRPPASGATCCACTPPALTGGSSMA